LKAKAKADAAMTKAKAAIKANKSKASVQAAFATLKRLTADAKAKETKIEAAK